MFMNNFHISSDKEHEKTVFRKSNSIQINRNKHIYKIHSFKRKIIIINKIQQQKMIQNGKAKRMENSTKHVFIQYILPHFA